MPPMTNTPNIGPYTADPNDMEIWNIKIMLNELQTNSRLN